MLDTLYKRNNAKCSQLLLKYRKGSLESIAHGIWRVSICYDAVRCDGVFRDVTHQDSGLVETAFWGEGRGRKEERGGRCVKSLHKSWAHVLILMHALSVHISCPILLLFCSQISSCACEVQERVRLLAPLVHLIPPPLSQNLFHSSNIFTLHCQIQQQWLLGATRHKSLASFPIMLLLRNMEGKKYIITCCHGDGPTVHTNIVWHIA